MASATASTRSEAAARWGDRFSLAPRILAVNVFAILMLMGAVFYLDSFRDRLIDERLAEMRGNAQLVASLLGELEPARRHAVAAAFRSSNGARLRLYEGDGRLAVDSWSSGGPRFRLRNPGTEPFKRDVARFLDRVIEGVGQAPRLPPYVEPAVDRGAWPEVAAARRDGSATALRRAADRTVIIAAAAAIPGDGGEVVHLVRDTRDITRVVRDERSGSFLVFLGVLALSLLLSNFLANTIVRPLRLLALAAARVRLGRAREVTVPRFARRRDEIGVLSRALSDMTLALRQRIDATEAFAADVAHELKNPLASLRSAVDTLETVRAPKLQAQLLHVIRDDVARIDRLITDIADASRLDAELSRTRFERIDLGALVGQIVGSYERRGAERGVRLAFARPESGAAEVLGEAERLAQVTRNLIDNALSFSPDEGVVVVSVARNDDRVVLRVDDDGPGIPEANRADIFKRFYSERPAGENFGRHSGLGLAIVRTIVEAHDGTVDVVNRERDGAVTGARFTVGLPAA